MIQVKTVPNWNLTILITMLSFLFRQIIDLVSQLLSVYCVLQFFDGLVVSALKWFVTIEK